MYSLGLLIVELETARRRLRYVFEVPDGYTDKWTWHAANSRWDVRRNWPLIWRIPTRLAFADRINRRPS